MRPLINIEIAGVNYAVKSRHKITLRGLPDPYKTFIKETISAADIVDVNIELGQFPTLKMKKIFDTGASWSMYVADNEYFAALNPPSLDGRRVWLARFEKDFSSAVVYCSELLALKTNGITTVTNPLNYPLDQILLMYYLSRRDGGIVHSAGVEYNGHGYIFPGRSGAGKSTISRQFAERKNFVLLSDDRLAIRKFDRTYFTYGTPWPGEGDIALNRRAPLSGIFFISHGSDNTIEEIGVQESLERILPLVSIPWYDPSAMADSLSFCEDLISHTPAYRLSFRPDSGVVDAFERFISDNASE